MTRRLLKSMIIAAMLVGLGVAAFVLGGWVGVLLTGVGAVGMLGIVLFVERGIRLEREQAEDPRKLRSDCGSCGNEADGFWLCSDCAEIKGKESHGLVEDEISGECDKKGCSADVPWPPWKSSLNPSAQFCSRLCAWENASADKPTAAAFRESSDKEAR